MPRLSRPTLKPNASSAWVTAFSLERDWANAAAEEQTAAAAAIVQARRTRRSMGQPTPIEAQASPQAPVVMGDQPAQPMSFLQEAAVVRLIYERPQDTNGRCAACS